MFDAGAEDNILAMPFGDMFLKYGVKPLRLLKRTAQRVEALLCRVTHGPVFGAAYAGLISLYIFLAGIYGNDICRRSEDAAHHRLAERHFRGDVAVKEFVGHVALIVEVTNVCRRQAKHRRLRIRRKQPLDSVAPHLRAAAVKFVEHDIVGADIFDCGGVHHHELGVGEETYVLRLGGARGPEVFYLRLKDVLTGREPADGSLRVLLGQFEADKRFSRAGGVDNGGLAVLL